MPITNLVRVAGTPVANEAPLDLFEFVRTIEVARITMLRARVRLSAGRQEMGDAFPALCFPAGANSIFSGETVLNTASRTTRPTWPCCAAWVAAVTTAAFKLKTRSGTHAG